MGAALKPGDVAPDFSVKDHEGHTVALKDLRGHTVVLWFYPRAHTSGCTAEGCSFRDLSQAFREKNAVIVGVSFDSVEDNQAFAKDHGFGFPLISDTDRRLGLAYGACQEATAATAQRIGVVIDPQGRIQKYYPNVEALLWPTEVLQMLQGVDKPYGLEG